jgi:hypothetical protein
MTPSKAVNAEERKEAKLPRRDWILLPLLSLLTIGLLAASTELIVRLVFPVSGGEILNCIRTNPRTGPWAIPNSVCWEKKTENQFVEYRFNSCGHRAGMECGPKPPGIYRIVLAGSSVAQGAAVSREKTFAFLLPQTLSQQTGRKIELYNAARGWGFPPRFVALNFNDVLSANPDMILWILTPLDIEDQLLNLTDSEGSKTAEGAISEHGGLDRALKSWWYCKRSAVSSELNQIRTRPVLTHYLYEIETQKEYVESYLRRGDPDSGFLKAQPSALWQKHLDQFDGVAADIEGQAKGRGLPLVVVYIPDRPQAAMLSMDHWPTGYDPYKLGDELRTIVTRHGGIYIDILPDYRNIPNPERGYFPVDGHPNADGHEILTKLIAKGLTGGAIPALRVPTQPQTKQEQGR